MVTNWSQMHVASCASTNDEVKKWIGEEEAVHVAL